MSRLSSPSMSTERQLAVGRFTLASFALLAVWLDPTEPHRNVVEVYTLLAAYTLYSLVVAVATTRAEAPARYGVLSYLVDLAVTFIVVFLSDGVSSPLFPLVVFVLLAAARRWEGRAALYATMGVLFSFLSIGAVTALTGQRPFELNDFLMRSATIVLIAVFLMSISASEERVRGGMQRVAAPPIMDIESLDQLLPRLIEWGAAVVGAPRAILVWEDSEEPWLNLVEWGAAGYRRTREAPAAMAPLVSHPLADVNFFCRHAADPNGLVVFTTAGATDRWLGAAVHPLVQSRFSMDATLSLAFSREHAKGRLFFLDKPGMTSDDLTLGELVSRHVIERLNHFYLRQDLAQTAVSEERLRMARDLHDGAFHVFAGVAMELERLVQTPSAELAGARDRLREIRDSLIDGQRGMRELIEAFKLPSEPTSGLGLEARIKSLVERFTRQTAIEIRCAVSGGDDLPRLLVDEIYLMVGEALVNVGRHAGATTAGIIVAAGEDVVKIVVTDDGRGFGFTGRYDHDTLMARGLGPWTLQQRAASLGGRIAIESGAGPTVLEIEVPVAAGGRR